MEDRGSWLPPGLESPGLEPDDRASQRGGTDSRGRSKDAAAAYEWRPVNQGDASDTPYDHESEGEGARETAKSDGGEAEGTASSKSGGGQEPAESQGEKRESGAKKPRRERRTRARRRQGEEQKPNRSRKQRRRREPQASGPEGQAGSGQPEHRGPSDVDAMGHDKYRKVVGHRYGLSRGRQFLYYGIFVAFVIAAYIGLKAAADSLDKAPAHDPDKAPWSRPGAPQAPLGGFETGRKGPTHFQ